MTLMLAHPEPADYVVASGATHSVRDPLDVSFAAAAVEDWEPFVVQDPALLRPAEPDPLCRDATRARTVLGWQPEHDFTSLVSEMVLADLAELSRS